MLNQWTSTPEVIQWFKKIENKKNKTFIQVDVVNFYPSINQNLLKNAIGWARQYIDISSDDEDIILKTKQSILYNEGKPWVKKEGNFDVAQGSFDGAECSELVGLYILEKIAKLDKLNPGIYRDDFLAATHATPRQGEALKKKIIQIFAEHDLGTTAAANLKVVNFLDVTFNMGEGTFQSYLKPGNIPRYVHKQSNHPPTIIKNIPENVNKRISSISSDEKMFKNASPIFQEALNKSGYKYTLRYDPHASEPRSKSKKKNRKRNILWYNPPYNSTVGTNVGREFLKLIDECFPPNHKLHKVFNRRNVKVSYSTTPNVAQIIAAKNSKILKPPETEKRKCNCPRNKVCPLEGKCLSEEIIYQATVTHPSTEPKTYIGLCSTDFKARLGVHTQSFKDPLINQTSLSQYVHELKSNNKEPKISWKIIDRGKKFTPVSGVCQLCTREAYYIVFHPNLAKLNAKSEIFSACRHKKPALLFPPERTKKKSPGT